MTFTTMAPRQDLGAPNYRILIENAVHITAIVGRECRITYISPVVERMLGYPPEVLVGTSCLDLIHPDELQQVQQRLAYGCQHPGSGQFVEFRARHRDGSWRILEAIATNRMDDPLIEGIVIDARDVTERTWTAERLQRSLDALMAIHEVGHRLGPSLERHAIETALLDGAMHVAPLDAAAVLLLNADGRQRVSQTRGSTDICRVARRARVARAARCRVLSSGACEFFRSAPPRRPAAAFGAWVFPLRANERTIGLLEVYGRGLVGGGEDRALSTLADQAAGALERARLYREIAERERRLEELVGRLFLAQEEDRRRVAYDIHDGLAQLAAAGFEHLEAFASRYRTRSPELRGELSTALSLVQRTVNEARRVIVGLRPTVLEDGLAVAIDLEVDKLGEDGWQIECLLDLGPERLPQIFEVALFRVIQEALSNVRKHAASQRVDILLQRRNQCVYLEVRDYGRGFRFHDNGVVVVSGPGEHIGLAGMQERMALLGGRCTIRSRPGAGTRVIAEVPVATTPSPAKSGRARPRAPRPVFDPKHLTWR